MAENAGVMENELHRAAQADGHWSKGWVQEEVGYAEVSGMKRTGSSGDRGCPRQDSSTC